MVRMPTRASPVTASSPIRSAATGSGPRIEYAFPGGAMRHGRAPGSCGTGAGPPRSQLRRLAARTRVAGASWSIASPERVRIAACPA